MMNKFQTTSQTKDNLQNQLHCNADSPLPGRTQDCIYKHTHTHIAFASFPLDSQSPIIHILSILTGQAESLCTTSVYPAHTH